jgi:hypothetical protein
MQRGQKEQHKHGMETVPNFRVAHRVLEVYNLLKQALAERLARANELRNDRTLNRVKRRQHFLAKMSCPLMIKFQSRRKLADFRKLTELCELDLSFAHMGTTLVIDGPYVGMEWFASALRVSSGLLEILHDYDQRFFLSHSDESITSCLRTFMSVDNYLEYIDVVKYSTTWMHARSLKQVVLPVPPTCWAGGPPLLFTGSIRRFLHNRISSGLKTKNQKLFWSIANDKRCADIVPNEFVQLSLEKHQKAMLKPASVTHPLFLSEFRQKCTRLIDQVFKTNGEKRVDDVYEYSTSACYEESASAGGAKYYLMRAGVDVYSDDDFVTSGSNELLKMDFDPRKGVSERRGYATRTHQSLLNDSVDEACEAKVFSICEPLKIRNITASNALPYTLAQGTQKMMHSMLKRFPQFALIGKSWTVEQIHEIISKGKKGDWIASGDFSAATDNVKIELTKIVFETIINYLITYNGLSFKHSAILRRVLYEHIIEYPKSSHLEAVEQQNGQLMGSVLSFPILCIINLITYWIAVDPCQTNFRQLNVIVNGDDIMFTCNAEQYQDWLDTLPEAGLFPSPGKNFFHRRYCTVNTALFHRVERHRTEYIPFYNVALLFGQSKVAKVEEMGDRHKPIHCLHAMLLEGASSPINADKRFRYYNLERLKKSSTLYNGDQLNWYLPRTMGGLGMKLPHGVEFCTTKQLNTSGYRKKGIEYVHLTNPQRALAYGLRQAWYKENIERSPFKPIGEEVDLDAQNWGTDIRKTCFKKAVLVCDPMPPDCEEIQDDYHPPNWYLPSTQRFENTVYQYNFRGLDYRRFALPADHNKRSENVCSLRISGKKVEYSMLGPENRHLYVELVLYKERYDRRLLHEVPHIDNKVEYGVPKCLPQEEFEDSDSMVKLDLRECDYCHHCPCQCIGDEAYEHWSY